jgi:CDP-diacylglycerol--serine O-phosphatidyltransferase
MACGALRLARFNVLALKGGGGNKKFFIGMPIPAAACVLSTLVLFSSHFPEDLAGFILPKACIFLIISLALLMISKVRYASFKDVEVIKTHPYTASIAVLLLFVLVASQPKMISFVFFIAYLLSGPIYTFIIFPLNKKSYLRGLSH